MNTLKAWSFAAANIKEITDDSQGWDRELADRAQAVGKIWDKMSGGGVNKRLLNEMATAVTAYVEYKSNAKT